MKLSTTLNPFILDPDRGMEPYIEELRSYKSVGFDLLDCIFCDGKGKTSPLRRTDWYEWGQALAEESAKLGITYHQCHLPTYFFADRGRSEDIDELTRRSLILSSVLGAKWTVVHPSTNYSLPSPTDSFRANYEYFAPLIEMGAKYSIGIAIENMADFDGPEKPWYCGKVEELIGLVDSFGADNVGICWDFGHANLVYRDQNPCLLQIGKRLKAVHVHDNDGSVDSHLGVFFGNVQWEPLMHTLRQIGYEGVFDFEVKRINWHLPREMREAQWKYVLATGKYLLSVIGE